MSFHSPLRYPGGKAFLAPFLAKVIEKNKLKDVTYVEPYAGGAGAALELLFGGKVSKVVINDKDRAIYTFWKHAVKDTDSFIKKIKLTPVSISEWKKQKAVYEDVRSRGLDLAFATFYLNRTNRSGIIEAGPIGGMEQTGKWKIDARFNKSGLIKRFEKIKEYRDNIDVTPEDGIALLEGFKREKRMNLFIFLDPPYFEKGQSLYLNSYGEEEHKQLAHCIQGSILKWVMTYDETSYIRQLYPKQNIETFELFHSAHVLKKGKEILIYPPYIEVPNVIK